MKPSAVSAPPMKEEGKPTQEPGEMGMLVTFGRAWIKGTRARRARRNILGEVWWLMKNEGREGVLNDGSTCSSVALWG